MPRLSLEDNLREKVCLMWLTSPYFELREKLKCIEHIGKSKIRTETSSCYISPSCQRAPGSIMQFLHQCFFQEVGMCVCVGGGGRDCCDYPKEIVKKKKNEIWCLITYRYPWVTNLCQNNKKSPWHALKLTQILVEFPAKVSKCSVKSPRAVINKLSNPHPPQSMSVWASTVTISNTRKSKMSHIKRKCVFRDFQPGMTQTSLLSYRN